MMNSIPNAFHKAFQRDGWIGLPSLPGLAAAARSISAAQAIWKRMNVTSVAWSAGILSSSCFSTPVLPRPIMRYV